MRAFIALFMTCFAMVPSATAEQITVFAAASMQDALNEAGSVWAQGRQDTVTVAAAGSAVLARQIAQGAPAVLYVSASPAWMDWLDDRGLLAADTRRDIAGNALVLISADAATNPQTPIAEALGAGGRLAVALTDAVPAGIYAREALTSIGQWEPVKTRLAETEHVRAALTLVALGEAPLGIVYLSDALSEPRVHIVAQFPEETHSAIRYPAAVIQDAPALEPAMEFLTWLTGEVGQAILARHGFAPAGGAP